MGRLASIEQETADSEYHITWQNASSCVDAPACGHAPNRAHGFRTYFSGSGIRVVPRTAVEAPEWDLRLALARWARGRWTVPPAVPLVRVAGHPPRVTLAVTGSVRRSELNRAALATSLDEGLIPDCGSLPEHLTRP